MKCSLLFVMLITTKAVMCLECPEGCTSCSSSDICTECEDGFSMRKQKCYYLCPASCTSCSKPQECVACKTGYYGVSCEHQCDTDCQADYCDKDTGMCTKKEEQGKTTASVEYNDPSGQPSVDDCPKNCEKCDENNKCLSCNIGFWGNDCDNACSEVCRKKTCDKVTGKCAPAYIYTTQTVEVIKPCQRGQYGERCEKECPENCLKSLCFQNNGTCVGDCPDGYFGERCNYPCQTKCGTTGCHRLDGTCFDDCTDGKVGDDCRQASAAQDSDNNDDDGTAKIIIGGVVGSFGVAIATVVVVVILVLRMKLRRTRANGLRADY